MENLQNKGTVYMHILPSNKRYVGITSMPVSRRGGHNGYGYKRTGHHKFFVNAIDKYGWDSFQHVIVLENRTESEAKYAEKYLIKGYRMHEGCYNLTDGGDGTCGLSKTPGNKGIACSQETKDKISKSNKGKESYGKGKHLSEETKQKISKTRLDRKITVTSDGAKKKIRVYNEDFDSIFSSVKDVSSFLNVSSSYVCDCLKHNRKCKKYTLEYA